MSLIVSEVYDALIEAGTSEEKAKAAAGALPLADRLATKEDLDELKTATRQDLDKLRTATQQDLEKLRTDTRAELDELRVSFEKRFARLERDMALLKFGYGPAILALLVKIAFF